MDPCVDLIVNVLKNNGPQTKKQLWKDYFEDNPNLPFDDLISFGSYLRERPFTFVIDRKRVTLAETVPSNQNIRCLPLYQRRNKSLLGMTKNIEYHILCVINANVADVQDGSVVTVKEVLQEFGQYDPHQSDYAKYTEIPVIQFMSAYEKIFHVQGGAVQLKMITNLPEYSEVVASYLSSRDKMKNKRRPRKYIRPTWGDKHASTIGVPPDDPVKRFVNVLQKYHIPSQLDSLASPKAGYTVYQLHDALHAVAQRLFNRLQQSYNPIKNYAEIFHFLLYVEEIQMKVDIREYDQHESLVTTDYRRNLVITVPGLAESRPSVLRGDIVYISDGSMVHKGFTHSVMLEQLVANFDERVKPGKYDVQFTYLRTILRGMHRAIDLVDKNHSLIRKYVPNGMNKDDKKDLDWFKSPDSTPSVRSPYIQFFNTNLNALQRRFVKAASSFIDRPKKPLVLIGPPGTGKTTTLVETIYQIIKDHPNPHVIACTPSNESADLLCSRLSRYNMVDCNILRVNAFQRDPRTIADQEVLRYCKIKDGSFVAPSAAEIMRCDIVVVTLSSSSYFYGNGIQNHFTHVVVDESGQGMEPEILLPFLSIMKDATIILGGDPKQLGPIIRSPVAAEYGLNISMLERLVTSPNCHQDVYLTKLVETYRAHPSIMSLYNTLFYDNRLVCRTDVQVANSLLNWTEFPNKKHPILFKHSEGLEARNQDSPSWYNTEEVDHVVGLVRSLFNSGLNVVASDIGVITPYRKQSDMIKQKLISKVTNGRDIKVGTVELFQGKEKRIIFLSCVRSQNEFIPFDDKYKLGFLKNPKRLNVAISRPMAGLVIVGNAKLLRVDPHWKKMINMCVEMGAFNGPDLSQFDAPAQVQNTNVVADDEDQINGEAVWMQDRI
ncbi:helicase mov-10-B [Acrasis kona]|uniref:RNA helicase n=1 Tax=Acrasis kona TaxID=1008807 RepID=A0AAW2ZK89_9EUKA